MMKRRRRKCAMAGLCGQVDGWMDVGNNSGGGMQEEELQWPDINIK